MAGKSGRTEDCDVRQARRRLDHARSYMDVAELAGGTTDADLDYAPVAASIAILAGIAAADAACCAALGRRSRSDNHQDAADLLTQIEPGGKEAGRQMRLLISLKDAAHYGFLSLRPGELKRAVRQAAHLIDFAEQVLLRSR